MSTYHPSPTDDGRVISESIDSLTEAVDRLDARLQEVIAIAERLLLTDKQRYDLAMERKERAES